MCRVVAATAVALAGLAAPALAAPQPPNTTASFAPAGIQPNQTSTLTITITNPNASTDLTGVGFTDTLPTNVVVATPNGLTNGCGGTATATAGSATVSLSGATVTAASPTCSVTVNVTSPDTGTYVDSTGPVASSAGAGTAATATLSVANPPTISKQFSDSSVLVGGTLAVYFTISNPNSLSTPPNSDVTLTGVSFTDPLPSGLVVANPNQASTDCGGTLTATPGASTITFNGGTITPAQPPDGTGGNCNIAVELQANSMGTKNNTTTAVSANESGPGSASNTASVTVNAAPVVMPPTITKAFSASTVAVNGTVQVYFTIRNPNGDPGGTTLNNVSFTDPLPAGLQVANPSQASTDCGGTLNPMPGDTTITFSGGTITPPQPPDGTGGTCDIAVTLIATSTGTKNNTTNAVTSTESNGGPSNTASVDVTSTPSVLPPTLSKQFGAQSIALGQATSLTFTVANPNASTTLGNVSFTDPLPTGLRVASPNGVSGACVTAGDAVSAVPGSGSISLTGLTLAGATSCQLVVNVVGAVVGAQDNATGNVAATYDSGFGDPTPVSGGGATASVAVTGSPPSISMSFGPAAINLGAPSTLTFTVTNPNGGAGLTGIAFSDSLPTGIAVANPSNAATTCGSGTLTAPPGGASVALAGGTIAAGGSCTVSLTVIGTRAGVIQNTSGAVSSNEAGTGNGTSASLTVIGPPTIALTTPSNGASYTRGQLVPASFGCTEDPNGPGLQSCTGTVPNGGAIDTSTVGPHMFSVTAVSKDGLTVSTIATYTVSPPSNRFVASHAHVLRNGTVKVDVTVPGSGAVDVLETAPKLAAGRSPQGSADVGLIATGTAAKGRAARFVFARLHTTATGARTLHLTIKPNAKGRAFLRTHPTVRIQLTITYTPSGGSSRSTRLTLKVKGIGRH